MRIHSLITKYQKVILVLSAFMALSTLFSCFLTLDVNESSSNNDNTSNTQTTQELHQELYEKLEVVIGNYQLENPNIKITNVNPTDSNINGSTNYPAKFEVSNGFCDTLVHLGINDISDRNDNMGDYSITCENGEATAYIESIHDLERLYVKNNKKLQANIGQDGTFTTVSDVTYQSIVANSDKDMFGNTLSQIGATANNAIDIINPSGPKMTGGVVSSKRDSNGITYTVSGKIIDMTNYGLFNPSRSHAINTNEMGSITNVPIKFN